MTSRLFFLRHPEWSGDLRAILQSFVFLQRQIATGRPLISARYPAFVQRRTGLRRPFAIVYRLALVGPPTCISCRGGNSGNRRCSSACLLRACPLGCQQRVQGRGGTELRPHRTSPHELEAGRVL